jgi:hypothetical protein
MHEDLQYEYVKNWISYHKNKKNRTFKIKKCQDLKKHHHDYHPPANAVKSKKNRSAVLIRDIFFGLIGAGITFFAFKPLWLIIGIVGGAIGGYYFGRQLDKSFPKSNLTLRIVVLLAHSY